MPMYRLAHILVGYISEGVGQFFSNGSNEDDGHDNWIDIYPQNPPDHDHPGMHRFHCHLSEETSEEGRERGREGGREGGRK